MPDIQMGSQAIPLPSRELNQGGTSTSEAQFLTASAQNGVAAQTSLICYLPGSSRLNRRVTKIRVGGRVNGGTATNFTAKLYAGTSSTIGSNVNIASTGAVATNGNQGTWALDVDVAFDSTNNVYYGLQRGWMINTAVAQAALTNSATFTPSSETSGFTITGTFSSGHASNAAYVDWFEVITN